MSCVQIEFPVVVTFGERAKCQIQVCYAYIYVYILCIYIYKRVHLHQFALLPSFSIRSLWLHEVELSDFYVYTIFSIVTFNFSVCNV